MASVGVISRTAFGETSESPAPLGEPSRDVASRDPISRAATLPPLPAEYVTEEASFWHVGYHPSARERIRSVMPRLSEMRDELRMALGSDVLEDVEIRIAGLDAEMVRLTPREVAPPPTGAVFVEQHLVVVSAADAARRRSPKSRDGDSLPNGPTCSFGGREPKERVGARRRQHRGSRRKCWRRRRNERSEPQTARNHSVVVRRRVRDSLRARTRGDSRRNALSRPPPAGRCLTSRSWVSAWAAKTTKMLTRQTSSVSSARPTRAPALPAVVEKVSGGSDLDEAIATAFGSDRAGVDRAWRRDMAKRYGLFPVLALSLALWLALWVVGLVRRRRAIAASESTVARMRALRRNRILDADGVITITTRPSKRDAVASPHLVEGKRQHDAVYADRPAAGVGGDAPTRSRSTSPGEATPPKVIEVPKIEHDGDWHTLH